MKGNATECYMISLEKIEGFRDEVNRDKFVLSKYRMVNGKNQWGCICSAMDWITVAIEYIMQFHTSKGNVQSMEMYAYISSIDVVWEGIQQLHRVLFPNKIYLPFTGKCECFRNRVYEDKDDNTYFKEIRACFGAHPVNLQGEKGERLFASWSGNFYGGRYSVILYSNFPEKPFKEMSIYIHELNAFLEERYNYLDVLKNRIQELRKNFYLKMQQKEISQSNNLVEQLQILRQEIYNRGECDYFEFLVERLQMIFDTPITEKENKEMVDRYRECLKPLIADLFIHVQNMDMSDIDDGLLFPKPTSLPNGYGYWLEKISGYISGVGYSPLYWEEQLKQIFAERIVMEYESYQELYVIILACMNELE